MSKTIQQDIPAFPVCDLGLKLIARTKLATGAHGGNMPPDLANPDCEMCVMEMRAIIGQLCGWWELPGLTDRPEGDSRVLAAFLQKCNDRWNPDERELLKEFVSADLRDKGPEIEKARTFRCADWAVREIAPKRFDILKMPEKAAQFRAFDPIVDKASARKADAYAAAADAATAAADAADTAATAAADTAARKPIIDETLSFIRELIAMGAGA